jgi:predicted nucleic acid-binding protein
VIVVDASVLLEVLLGTSIGQRAGARLIELGEELHAPHVLDLEVAHALRRQCAAGTLKATRAAEAIQDLGDFPVMRHAHDFLLPRIWLLRHTVTAYDAAYLALADALDATLVTRDARLVKAAGRTRVEQI